MINTQETKTKLMAVAISTSMLLGGTGYLYYDNHKIKELNENQKKENRILRENRNKLQKEIASIRSALEQYKGRNKELDQLIVSANKEILAKGEKINALVRDNTSLKRFQKEVMGLRKLNEAYLAKIKALEEKLGMLSSENQDLMAHNSELKKWLSKLEERNAYLERQVSMASLLRADNILVIGEKKVKEDKYVKSRLKRADRFLVSFDLVENRVAEAGEKTLVLRVINPAGKLIENTTADVFTNLDKNMSLPYTQKYQVNYQNNKERVMLPVELNAANQAKGTYTLELYCDGYFCGVKKLNLK